MNAGNAKSIGTYTRQALLALTLLLSSCVFFASWDSMSKSWVGRPVERFIQLNGAPATVERQGPDLTVYRFDLPKIHSSCVHYWLVNDAGVIVDYRYTGWCRPIG